MDFGIGFLSNNIMLPILDFFYGIVPSYGLAIVALTLVIRLGLYPLNAGSIRNMRRMKVTQPLMKKRQAEIEKLYKDDPVKKQEEMANLMKEFNPLAGCLPLLLQMPILFALFATLRGSPFANINYSVNVEVLPQDKIERVQPKEFTTSPKNIYVDDGVHFPIVASMPGGNNLAVGEKQKIEFKSVRGTSLNSLLEEYSQKNIQQTWKITKGEDKITIDEEGNIVGLEQGSATVEGTISGIAAEKGFLFIEALGRVGAFDEDGTVRWDILIMVIGFGISIYASQTISGKAPGSNSNPNQDSINKITPFLFSGIFLFTPLPAGVLLYMLVANIVQTIQAYILSKEPLPENIQKIVDEEEAKAEKAKGKGRESLPFERGRSKKKA